jgi:ribosomal protein L40E
VPCEARLGADGDSLMEDRETKYCIECGAAIAKRAKYCAQCGVYQL